MIVENSNHIQNIEGHTKFMIHSDIEMIDYLINIHKIFFSGFMNTHRATITRNNIDKERTKIHSALIEIHEWMRKYEKKRT